MTYMTQNDVVLQNHELKQAFHDLQKEIETLRMENRTLLSVISDYQNAFGMILQAQKKGDEQHGIK